MQGILATYWLGGRKLDRGKDIGSVEAGWMTEAFPKGKLD